MRYSLIISTLIISIALTSTLHAASGDITIGTRTYTIVQADTQIVAPLFARLDRKKVAKTKLRLTNLAIRQYTLRQKSAEKQGKIELAQFYTNIIARLTTMRVSLATTQTSSTGSTTIPSNTASITPAQQITTKGTVVNNGNTINSGTAGSYNGTSGMTQEQITQRLTENEVFTAYAGSGGDNQSKTRFLSLINQVYGSNTYAVQYANTLVFNQP